MLQSWIMIGSLLSLNGNSQLILEKESHECPTTTKLKIISNEQACSLKNTTTKIKLPMFSNFTSIHPQFTVTQRCVGACSSFACNPTVQRRKIIDVVVQNCTDDKQCQRECHKYMIIEDVSCGCECSEQLCQRNKVYNPKSCSCECKNQKRYKECTQNVGNWIESSCICVAPKGITTDGDRCPDNWATFGISIAAMVLGLITLAVSVFCWLTYKYNQYLKVNSANQFYLSQ